MKKGRTVLQAKRFGIHSCSMTTSLVVAIRLMVDEEIGSLVVTDDQGYLAGVVTRTDILKAHVELENWAAQLVRDFMHRDVPVVTPQTPLIDAAQFIFSHPLGQVVVVLPEGDKQRPVAMLTDSDLAYHLVKGG
jgi:predicted transcriptional regulator